MSRYVMSYEPNQLDIREFLKKLQGKNAIDIVMKSLDYAEVKLEPGCSVGYHEHHNESETYYILSGEGQYNDNGTIRTVKKGEVTFTGSGFGHGMENVSNENLVFIGLILLGDK